MRRRSRRIRGHAPTAQIEAEIARVVERPHGAYDESVDAESDVDFVGHGPYDAPSPRRGRRGDAW